MASFTHAFLDKFSRDTNYFLSNPFLWTLRVDGPSKDTINTTVKKLGNEFTAYTHPDEFTDKENGALLLAQEVALPGESFQVSPHSVENFGSFMPGYSIDKRTDYLSNSVAINLLETKTDIVDGYIKPWHVSIGIDGLLNFKLRKTASGSTSSIIATQYDNQLQQRKRYTFRGVFPTNVEGYTLQYQDRPDFLARSITFGFTNYIQEK